MNEQLWLGAAAGIATALCWASGSLMFSRIDVPAAGLNLFKNALGALLFIVTLAVVALARGRGPVVTIDGSAWSWLAASSLVGLLIGDTLYFRSLQILGPRRALVLALSVPPLAAVFSWWALDESPSGTWGGMGVTLIGVAWVIRERGRQNESPGYYPGSATAGILCGLGASLCQAMGSVWTKQGLRGDAFPGFDPGPGISELEGSFVRLGVAFAAGILLYAGRVRHWVLAALPSLGGITLATIVGTYLGIWLSLIAYKKAPLSIATTLTSLSPVFAIPLVRIFFGVRVSRGAIFGVLVALLGVVLLVGGWFSGQGSAGSGR